jgi:hypothetical protein
MTDTDSTVPITKAEHHPHEDRFDPKHGTAIRRLDTDRLSVDDDHLVVGTVTLAGADDVRTLLTSTAPVPQEPSGKTSAESPLADLLPLPSLLLSRPRRVPTRRRDGRRRPTPGVPCFTCGLSPTGTYEDGSPRYDHGHDPVTGETWWAPKEVASAHTCPACRHEHPAGTTCRQCEACQALDLMPQAEEIFGDLLPGGSDTYGGLLRHNHNLGLYAACDGSCGFADCRRPYFDRAGLTCYRDGSETVEQMLAAPIELLDIPIEDDYPKSAWEVDR